MKKLFILLFVLCFKLSFSQTLPNFKEIKLVRSSDYKNADSYALNAANYLLSTPFDKDNINRSKSLQFTIKWMTGTPYYTFNLDGFADKVIRGNDDLLALYMTAMVKYCLENKSSAEDTNLVKFNAIKLLLVYCENSHNNMKMNKQLQKLSEANKIGELEKFLEKPRN